MRFRALIAVSILWEYSICRNRNRFRESGAICFDVVSPEKPQALRCKTGIAKRTVNDDETDFQDERSNVVCMNVARVKYIVLLLQVTHRQTSAI